MFSEKLQAQSHSVNYTKQFALCIGFHPTDWFLLSNQIDFPGVEKCTNSQNTVGTSGD